MHSPKIPPNKEEDNGKINIFEDHSQKLLPINLPLFESEIHTTLKTQFIIHGLKMARLMVAMLKAVQMAFQDSYIGPINSDSSLPNLSPQSQVLINLDKFR
jgi:hypothetical protein